MIERGKRKPFKGADGKILIIVPAKRHASKRQPDNAVSIIATGRLHGRSALAALKAALAGEPVMRLA